MKNSNDTIGNRTRDLQVCSAVPQPTAPPRTKLHRRGRAMAQAVCGRPPAAESRVRSWVGPCGIYGGQSGTGTGFSTSTSIFPCQLHSTGAPVPGETKKLIIFITGLHKKPRGCGASVASAAGPKRCTHRCHKNTT
jgi:hypothetical protein